MSREDIAWWLLVVDAVLEDEDMGRRPVGATNVIRSGLLFIVNDEACVLLELESSAGRSGRRSGIGLISFGFGPPSHRCCVRREGRDDALLEGDPDLVAS
jgi:hypothetical protein